MKNYEILQTNIEQMKYICLYICFMPENFFMFDKNCLPDTTQHTPSQLIFGRNTIIYINKEANYN